MATYVLIHGGGDSPHHWHLLAPLLQACGHDVVVPNLPCEDEDAGFRDYADTVVEAIGERRDPIVVAPVAGAGSRRRSSVTGCSVRLLVLVAGMVPLPGEKGQDLAGEHGLASHRRGPGPGSWTTATRSPPTTTTSRATLACEAMLRTRRQADRPGEEPWPLPAWPDVPTRYPALHRGPRLPRRVD